MHYPGSKTLLGLVLCLSMTGSVHARVKLVALPERDTTTIRFDNPAGTLVEEERILTLQQGRNQVDFSWNGVQINPDSIRLKILSDPESINLLSVSYPPNEAALVWDISCKQANEVRVRISYLLDSIDRLITYKAVANQKETEASLRSFVVVRNFSGEDFTQANVVLNDQSSFDKLSVQNEETMQLLYDKIDVLKISKVWTFDANELPWDPEKVGSNVGIPVSYEISNTKKNGLGKGPLPSGKIRVYQHDNQNSTIFLGEDQSSLTPVGEDMKVYIGDSRDIVVTQRKMKDRRINIRRNRQDRIVLYDTDEQIVAEIENFKNTPARLTMVQHIPGEWKMNRCNIDYEREDISTLKFDIELPPNSKQQLVMDYNRLNLR